MHLDAELLEVPDEDWIHRSDALASLVRQALWNGEEHALDVRREAIEPTLRVHHDARLVRMAAQDHVLGRLIPRGGEREERGVVEAIDGAGLEALHHVGDIERDRIGAERTIDLEMDIGLLRTHPEAAEIRRRTDTLFAREPRAVAVLRPQSELHSLRLEELRHLGLHSVRVERLIGLALAIEEVGGFKEIHLGDHCSEGCGRTAECLKRALCHPSRNGALPAE